MARWRIGALLLGLSLTACSVTGCSVTAPSDGPSDGPAGSTARSAAPTDRATERSAGAGSSSTASTPAQATGPQPSDGRPRRARLTVRRLGIVDLPVVPYRGRTDDAPGTRIQDRGLAASPHGPAGGAGPGGIGNYQVTAHRLSSTKAFLDLPRLRRGDRVVVEVGKRRYVYRITDTRRTSFRSPESLRQQRAPVPGRPGVRPTRAMITLSTCATPEDRAAGNHWSDEFGNPEHRIDKIGVLVASR
ncbi:class E sortase [Nocardioides sp. SYSU DS0651]|uniref:class E sortase n=1 Tax=Nocardioides sp. SYSU DS0651 TaxID=3415955 RepID=UPI003F4C890A